ncbi:hypothetical protein Tco_1343552 [Tanacetum coccineum]
MEMASRLTSDAITMTPVTGNVIVALSDVASCDGCARRGLAEKKPAFCLYSLSPTITAHRLNAMILEMESMNDPEEFYDALFCLRDDKRVEYNTLMAVNGVIAKAEEKLTTKEAHLKIIEAEINPV